MNKENFTNELAKAIAAVQEQINTDKTETKVLVGSKLKVVQSRISRRSRDLAILKSYELLLKDKFADVMPTIKRVSSFNNNNSADYSIYEGKNLIDVVLVLDNVKTADIISRLKRAGLKVDQDKKIVKA